jgi:signal transduction histidine kinase
MTNRLRTRVDEEDDELEQRHVGEDKSAKDFPDNDLIQFLSKRVFNAEAATRALPFVLFLFLLGMIYIANMNLAEKNTRDIEKISKQLKDLSSDYKTTKAELAFKSTLTEVAKRVDTLGIKESTQPPQKLVAEEAQNEH